MWKACRAGGGCAQGAGILMGWWMCLSHTKLVSVPAGWCSSHSTQSWSMAGPEGWRAWRAGSSCSTCSWGSPGPERHCAQWAGIPACLGLDWGWGMMWLRGGYLVMHGSGTAWEVGIPLCMGLAQDCGLAQPKGWRAQQNGAVAPWAYQVRIWQTSCFFIRLWCGEALHYLRV
jgi:hypothetical protein